MKIIKNITAYIFILILASGCEMDEDNLYSLDYISAPANVSAIFDISQDDSGLVTIMPSAEGAQEYKVSFGDLSEEIPTEYNVTEVISHTYSEGVYTVTILAIGITGLETEFTQELTVSFNPPENLVILAENDLAVSKQVNISATADYATVFDVFFGEGIDEEPTIALPGETISHIYALAGDYDITIVAKGGAIATLDSTFTFTVTEIIGPLNGAPEPPVRLELDVISIFSDMYSDIEGTDFNPNWDQSTVVTTEDITGNSTLIYANLDYQGTLFGSTVDASSMEYLHIDMWTHDATLVNIYPISIATGEKSVELPIVSDEWKSYDIPISDFTDQGLSLADLHQFKFDETGGSTIYLDNIYFYKGDPVQVTPIFPLDFESATIDYAFMDFDGGAVTVIDNPESSGINTSSKVTQMIKSSGQTWGGSWLAMENPIDFSTNKTFKMKVFSPRIGAKVLLKVENMDNGGISFENETLTTSANSWEELSFDYSTISTSESYQKLVIIFELGIMGDGSADFTFLLDDIVLTN